MEEDSGRVCPVTVWFVHDVGEYEAALPSRRTLAARSRLWIVWQKGRRDGLNGNFVRERAGHGAGGLQDLFARRSVERDGVHGEEGAEVAWDFKPSALWTRCGRYEIYSIAIEIEEAYMLWLSRVKIRLAGVALIAGTCAFAQVPKKQTAAPKEAKSSEPKFKAIWEPVNVKDDIELRSVHFTSPEEGWVAGGRTGMQGGVILHTANGGASWEVQLGDLQSADRAYHDLRFLGPTMGWAVQSTGAGDHKLLRLDGKEWKDVGTVAQHRGDYRFTSAQVGFVTSRGILRTQDGGRRWQPVHRCEMTAEVKGLTRKLPCEFAKLFFLNERTGWAISNAGASGTGFVIARTQDGGATWEDSVVLPGRPTGGFDLFYG